MEAGQDCSGQHWALLFSVCCVHVCYTSSSQGGAVHRVLGRVELAGGGRAMGLRQTILK